MVTSQSVIKTHVYETQIVVMTSLHENCDQQFFFLLSVFPHLYPSPNIVKIGPYNILFLFRLTNSS